MSLSEPADTGPSAKETLLAKLNAMAARMRSNPEHAAEFAPRDTSAPRAPSSTGEQRISSVNNGR